MGKSKATKPAPVPKDLSVSDLNDDPSLVGRLTKTQIKSLQKEAESTDVALAGSVRQRLNALYNENYPAES